MNNKAKSLANFKGKLAKNQIIQSLITKNLKGGAKNCPPPVEE